MEIDIALDTHAIIGESPTWVPTERALYWIDVKEPALHRYDPQNGADQSWPVTSDVGAFALWTTTPRCSRCGTASTGSNWRRERSSCLHPHHSIPSCSASMRDIAMTPAGSG